MGDEAHVRNGLYVGPCFIDEETGDITTPGLVNAANSGTTAGIVWQIMTSSYDCQRYLHYFQEMNIALTATLPANPLLGDWVAFKVDHQAYDTPLLIRRNGKNIEGVADDLIIDIGNVEFTLVYANDTTGWVV